MDADRKASIIAFVQADTRTTEEIFASIKQRIQSRYSEPLPESEAIAATRRLIGFYQAFVDKSLDENLENLDSEPLNRL